MNVHVFDVAGRLLLVRQKYVGRQGATSLENLEVTDERALRCIEQITKGDANPIASVPMKRLTTRTVVLVLLALACDSATEPGACPESVAAHVVASPGSGAPEFRWSPSCRISYLLVSGADQDQVLWMLVATKLGFLPGVRYATIPAGAAENVPAVPLVAGGEYYLTLGTVIGGDAVMVHATSRFVR